MLSLLQLLLFSTSVISLRQSLSAAATILLLHYPPDKMIFQGSTIDLFCPLTSGPIGPTVWKKTEQPVPRSAKTLHGGLSLRIERVQPRDGGTYQCCRRNVTVGQKYISIEEPQLSLEPIAPVIVGATARIVCTGNAENVQWLHGQTPVFFRNRNLGQGKFALEIPSVRYSDRGLYTCRGHYFRLPTSKDAQGRLVVLTKPTVSVPQPRESATLGQRVEIKCQVTGDPSPNTTWHFESMSGNRVVSTTSVLLLHSLQSHNKGNYCCEATNAVGNDKRCVQVGIQDPEPDKRVGILGEELQLKCSYTPPAKTADQLTTKLIVRLLQSGKDVALSRDPFILTNGPWAAYVTLSNLTFDHSGMYDITVQVANKQQYLGHCKHNIQVMGPPSLPGNVRVAVVRANAGISVTWEKPGLCSCRPVSGYHVTVMTYEKTRPHGSFKGDPNARHANVTAERTSLEATFTNVCNKETVSTVRVRAYNQYGVSRYVFGKLDSKLDSRRFSRTTTCVLDSHPVLAMCLVKENCTCKQERKTTNATLLNIIRTKFTDIMPPKLKSDFMAQPAYLRTFRGNDRCANMMHFTVISDTVETGELLHLAKLLIKANHLLIGTCTYRADAHLLRQYHNQGTTFWCSSLKTAGSFCKKSQCKIK